MKLKITYTDPEKTYRPVILPMHKGESIRDCISRNSGLKTRSERIAFEADHMYGKSGVGHWRPDPKRLVMSCGGYEADCLIQANA